MGLILIFRDDVLVRSDLGENGMRRAEAMDEIQEMNPTLEQNQAKYQLYCSVLTKYHTDGKIKKKSILRRRQRQNNGLLLRINHSGSGMVLLLACSSICGIIMWVYTKNWQDIWRVNAALCVGP